MKNIINIELYELLENEYLLAFIDEFDKEIFAETIPKKDKGKIYTSIIKQITVSFKESTTNNMKIQCEDCLKFFKKKDIKEIILTQKKLCKYCYERRKKYPQIEDPYPFP